jgi:AraC family transcriptional regulator of adaptative response/methylated-DNA-[protein]-cysteine methyltransferase
MIYYSIVQCDLGFLAIASTRKGICAVQMDDSQPLLIEELKKIFENKDICEADEELSVWVKDLTDYISGNAPWPKLPYDVKATAFQQSVWAYLRRIPEGKTMCYSEIAASLGRPKAARAVGQACAANPAAIVIPCHRAVPKSGGFGAYRWGAERKKRLLEIEKQQSGMQK